MKTKLVIATLLAGSSLFAETHFSIGVGVGHGYVAPPAYAYRAPSPGPGYAWMDGYWDYAGPRRFWHNSYWARQSFGRSFVEQRRDDRDRHNGNRFDGNDRDGRGNNFSNRDDNHRR